jgi:hypothetical protein
VRRVDYSQEAFSIAVPVTWSEIEPSVLAAMPAVIRQAAPNAPDIRIRHGFKAAAGPSYPWVALIITEEPVDEMSFENMDWANRSVDRLLKNLESAGGKLERAKMNSMSYDKSHHLLWSISQSSFSGVGDLRTLSGAYLTTTGSIQVHCYSRAADFVKDQQLCKGIIESVVIDPRITIATSPAKSPILEGLKGTDYQTLVRRVEAGDFTVDFRALRLACMKSTQCEPTATKAALGAINRAESDHDFARVVEITERLVRQGFVNLEAHADSVKAYEAIQDSARSKFHLDVTGGLLRSILFSGDGKSKETAFEVISDREEILTLAAKHLPYSGSGVSTSAIEENSHRYDRWEILDPKTGKTVVLFFNTDAFSTKSRARAN